MRSLIEQHIMNRSDAVIPGVGDIALVVGKQKNRGIWIKGKVLLHIERRDGRWYCSRSSLVTQGT